MIRELEIKYSHEGTRIFTLGFATRDLPELRINTIEESLIHEGEAFLRFIVNYMKSKEIRIKPNETVAYGYWVVRFQQSPDWFLEVWENNPEGTKFVEGAQLALTYWRDQNLLCRIAGATFSPPRPDQLVVISAGVLEGYPVQGVRYPSPANMSGWWITTDQYDGHVKSLEREHLYHVTAARPDLARYIALPHGYRFDLSDKEDIWFDSEVANSSPK
jgi:hypothetical protein